MTKQELVNSLAKEFSLTKKQANKICDMVFHFVGSSLSLDREFKWPGFGEFIVNEKSEVTLNE